MVSIESSVRLEFNLLSQLQLSCYLVVGKKMQSPCHFVISFFYRLFLFFLHWICLRNWCEGLLAQLWCCFCLLEIGCALCSNACWVNVSDRIRMGWRYVVTHSLLKYPWWLRKYMKMRYKVFFWFFFFSFWISRLFFFSLSEDLLQQPISSPHSSLDLDLLILCYFLLSTNINFLS